MALILASKSPRRQQLMRLITPNFETCQADVDENAFFCQNPLELAKNLAEQKAKWLGLQKKQHTVIGCDTLVQIDDFSLGKPKDENQGREMLKKLSGRRHMVHTGVCIFLPGGHSNVFSSTTYVDFAIIPQNHVDSYLKTAEPYDKAGAYGIQGWAARYITGINGCFYNVMGLPVAALYQKMLELGVQFV